MSERSIKAGNVRKGYSSTASATTGEAQLTLDQMRSAVALILGEESSAIGDNDDLIGRGIDSVQIMRLANVWRRSGIEMKFAELIERPTLEAWWELALTRLAMPRPTYAAPEVDETAPFELAPMQQAYWIGRSDGQVLGGVNAHYYAEFDGEGVEPERLEHAVRVLIARHGMLRARFLEDGRQQILPESPWIGVTVHDLRRLPGDGAEHALDALRERLSHRRLEAKRGEVFDVQLSLLTGGATRMHVNIDMLVSDAQSFQIILNDLAQLYLRPGLSLPPIRYSFPRYLAEQAKRRADAYERARAYWQEHLGEMPGAPQLPLAVEPERLSRRRIKRHYYWMSPLDWNVLAERSRQHGLTLPATLATVLVEVLAAWSAEPRFLLNLPLFDREDLHPDVPLVVGDFTNLIILTVDASGELPFDDRARRLQAQLQADAAHAEYSGLEVLRDLARMHPGDWMMAPVVFTSAIGLGDLFGANVRRCFGTPGWTTSQTPQVWLDQQVTESNGGLLLNWDVVEELFPEDVSNAMFAAYLGLLRWLGNPGSDWNSPVPPLLPRSQAKVREAVNATQGPETDRLLHTGFFEQAGRQPDRIALAWGDDGQLSYRALADQALRIAGLLRDCGVRLGEAVAVTMSRGPDQIAAVLGVVAAGGVYVPVGVDQPIRRRAKIYENALARVVLTTLAERSTLEWPEGIKVLPVEATANVTPLREPVLPTRESLAYVIYTSGSTGEPKGVEITHRAAMNTIDDVNSRFAVNENDCVLAVSALDFDLSVFDIFGLLSTGGEVVLVEEEARREARRWAELVRRWGVTVWNSVPALLDMLLVATDAEGPPLSLRLALVSGDWVGVDLPGRLAVACPSCRFVALGGATEASIWSNLFEVSAVSGQWRSIPYGHPLRNQKYRVVDARRRDCPDYVPGELWIGGSGIAQGYRGDPARTAVQFVERDRERWYRTGDIGRYWPDGTLEFLGRADQQVKIRGHRIELGEIEAALQAHPYVLRAAAAASGERGGRIAVAVIIREPAVVVSKLRLFLADRLPPYMVPDDLVVLQDLPLNPNGKVDRKALARLIDTATAEVEDEQPQGPIETAVARLWADVLAVPGVGRRRSFFSLGGDSLLATRLVEALRQRFTIDVSLRQLFTTPTVMELAGLIAGNEAESAEEGII